MAKVMRYMKNVTKKWKKTKSKTFYAEQIKEIIEVFGNSDLPRDRLFGIAVMLSYHGLMRKSEVMEIAVRDVAKLSDGIFEVYFQSVRKNDKTEMAEFKFILPEYCSKSMEKYIEELGACATFLKIS